MNSSPSNTRLCFESLIQRFFSSINFFLSVSFLHSIIYSTVSLYFSQASQAMHINRGHLCQYLPDLLFLLENFTLSFFLLCNFGNPKGTLTFSRNLYWVLVFNSAKYSSNSCRNIKATSVSLPTPAGNSVSAYWYVSNTVILTVSFTK